MLFFRLYCSLQPSTPVSMSHFKYLVFILLIFISSNIYATWSIIAVDRKTGEIGIAGASCTFDVSGIASIVPGKGAIVVQAASNYFARMKGVSLINANASQEEIFNAIRHPDFNPEDQQYGIILLDSELKPSVYSGTNISGWHGKKVDFDFAVIGNLLPGKQVIEVAFKTFESNRDKPLAVRLMLALKAGEQAGGDKRCGSQFAKSAFIMLYDPKKEAILKLAIQGMEAGGKPAVSLLKQEFDSWYSKK